MTLGISRKGWRQSAEFATCAHPSAVREHTDERARDWIVTGLPSERPAISMSFCGMERSFTGPEHCGPDGRFWESRGPNAPTGWRDRAVQREVLLEILYAWRWLPVCLSVGLAGGALLSWAVAP